MEQQTEENCPESYFCPISQELMEDPVMDPEGNTYERRNIETWLQQNATSPITRSPLRITDLVPNRALREAIEAHKKAGKSTAKPALPRKVISGAAPELPPVVVNAVARRDTEKEDEYEVLLSVQPPEGTIRTPSNICCVVDVSGSMGSEATLKNASGQTESHGLSLLDIVKHAVRTIVATLNANDQLAIVTYSSKAETVFRLRPMDKRAKEDVNKVLDHLEADGSTNLWDGLHTGLELLRQEEQTTSGRYNSLLLLTDGLPNISPPRGEVGMLQRYNDQYPNVACTISTFGFGYDINSDLLKNLAVTGRGMYAFIPDSSFVGTAFVHAASNALTTMARDVSLSLEPINGTKIVDGSVRGDHIVNITSWGLSVNLCSLQYGQSKDLVVRVVIPNAEPTPFLNVTVDYIKLNDGQPEKVTVEATERDDSSVEVEVQRFRLAFVDTLKRSMTLFRQNKQEEAKEGIEKLVAWIQDLSSAGATKDPRVIALLEDLTGQVTEALSKEEYYKKWGQHYLPSLMRAHQLQQCNNFKDPGIQHYGGKLFSALRDEVDDIFCKLPPPKPTYPINSHGGFVHAAPPMSVYHSNSNPCFAGESVVMMADGTRKRVADIVKGDLVATSLTRGGAAEVVCVVKTHCGEGRVQLVELEGGLRVTPYHPVRMEGGEGRWYFPCMLGEVKERECPAVYSFVLQEAECGGGVMVINGVECVALGHGLQDDEGVVGHPYFGTSRVIEDLRRMAGWVEGLVELRSGCMVRDTKTGLVCGLRQQPHAQQQQTTLCGTEVDIVASSSGCCCEECGECVA